MNVKRFAKINKREVVKKLFENGFVNEYENDIIIDALERRSNELYTKSQVKGFKLFYPNADIVCKGAHEFVIKSI